MGKITIRVMGIDDEKKIITLIMQSVSREGIYKLPIKREIKSEDLMANKLVQYKILSRNIIKNLPPNPDEFVYSEGEHFAKANLIDAFNFIENEKLRLNPNTFIKNWNYVSNNNLISAIIGALVGVIAGSLITLVFTR